MRFAEVIVNVPIRRSFRAVEPPTPDELDAPGAAAPDDDDASYQTFHYHLPLELENVVQPGHLVWVSFGAREVQGFVLALTDSSPVPTKPVLRLARRDPVLTRAQLELAAWISREYVASLAESVKLFLPPGLLVKESGTTGVRAKREVQVRWLGVDRAEALSRLAHEYATEPGTGVAVGATGGQRPRRCVARLRSTWTARRCAVWKTKGLVTLDDGTVSLAQPPAAAQAALDTLRGLDKYIPVIDALCDTTGPIWKSDLYAQAHTTLATLRALQKAGLINLDEVVRFRDPLNGRIYPPTRPPRLTGEQAAVWEQVQGGVLARLHGAHGA